MRKLAVAFLLVWPAPATPPWWADKIVVPAFFTVIGALVGWLVTEIREKRHAASNVFRVNSDVLNYDHSGKYAEFSKFNYSGEAQG